MKSWMVFWGVVALAILAGRWAAHAHSEAMAYVVLVLFFVAINRCGQAVHDHRVAHDQRIRERVKLEFRTAGRR